jgi:hypothetical protein
MAKRPRGSFLESLLADPLDYKNPLKGFMLTAPYITQSVGNSTNVPVPLIKSFSAPATCFADRVVGGEFGNTGLEASSSEPSTQWQCRGCGTKDRSNLSTNTDSSIACDLCGAVDTEVSLISGNRQKMCAVADDKTIVGDFPSRDADEAAAMALADGDETLHARRQRHLDAAGGTRVPRTVSRKSDVCTAQARVDTATARDSKSRIDGDPKFVRKRTAVLRFITTVQQLLGPSLDERLKRHIRMEAARVVASGFEHAQCCSDAKCQILIPSRANALVALCTVEKCLERLVCEGTGPSIADIAPDVSRHQLLKSLDEIRQMQTSGAGASQRAQVAAAIGIAINWFPEQVALPCTSPCSPQDTAARQANEPPPLHLPPPLHASAPKSDNEDVIWALRNAIHSAWRLANERADIRQTATAAVQEPALSEWIRVENTLPICVLGVVMLKAAALKLELESSVDELLLSYCSQNDLSPTTANNVAVCITKIMHAERKTTLGVFGDGARCLFFGGPSWFLSSCSRLYAPCQGSFETKKKKKTGGGGGGLFVPRVGLTIASMSSRLHVFNVSKRDASVASTNRCIHNTLFQRLLTRGADVVV